VLFLLTTTTHGFRTIAIGLILTINTAGIDFLLKIITKLDILGAGNIMYIILINSIYKAMYLLKLKFTNLNANTNYWKM
jgi:hypothetical protein